MRISILSGEEIAALLSYVSGRGARDELLIRIMLNCGLRASEVVSLDVKDVWRYGHVASGINIPGSVAKGGEGRIVDIPESLKPLIAKYVALEEVNREVLNQFAPLFIGKCRKSRLTKNGLWRIVAGLSTAAIGKRIHPHTLRHCYATALLRVTNIRVVQQLLGHARLATTEIYTHVNSEDCRTAVNQAFN